ncbi:MAG: ABC transporter substrate-binding protein [Clostridia bacterium]|nr:ABC transporter substrate-binding protein [Clostridia bacterium]
MKKNKILRLIGIFLVLVMMTSIFSACQSAKTPGTGKQQTTTPLVVGYLEFSEKFSPFFADTGYDNDVVAMTQVSLLTTDRTGAIVYKAIKGETIPYNGVDYLYTGIADVEVNYDEAKDETVYLWTIRNDIKFSDGKKMTADDIIFSYYAYSDPAYVGSSTLYSVPIIGMNNYRTQTSDEVFEKFDKMWDDINAAGADHVWSPSDTWTKEQQEAFWAMNKEEWMADVQAIVDYVNAKYSAYFEDYTGYTPDQVKAEPGLQIMAGMVLWGFGSTDEEGALTSAVLEKKWTLKDGDFPTIEDYYNETFAAYGGNIAEYAGVESPGDNAADVFKDKFIRAEGPKDPSLGEEGIPNIAGIKKLSKTQVSVTVKGFDASAIYKLGIQVSPLHYYGDETKYDYDNNKFGFDFGDLSKIQEKTTQPMGAGPYKFIKFENKIVYFEANEHYYRGEPLTYYMQFKVTNDADKIPGVATGTIDIADPSFGNAQVEEIKSYNSNGGTTGDKITTSTVDNLGYGYVGINAATVNVGGIPDSEESKNLRKALATLLAVYRSLSVDSYYGERASVINYPISNTSWAAPQKSDDGYKVAFSTALDGSDIYTSTMNADERYAAALDAAIDYFVAAGYTYDSASKKLTAAPAGAKLEYEIIVPAGGSGDHPSFVLATKFKEALESIGMTIILNDPADSNVLWDKLDAATQEMWAAAWGATIDPDMYQVYHSNNVIGNEGSSESNHYHIQDAELDQLILDARTSPDQAFRKATYKACLDIIIDWAVEVPTYQRQNCIIFSTERVNIATVTPDITTFWGWANDIELLEMNVAE